MVYGERMFGIVVLKNCWLMVIGKSASSGEVMLDAMEQSIADFRIFRGKDYDITLDVKRQAGDGAILIGVRDQLETEC